VSHLIRQALESDYQQLSELTSQLGYPAPEGKILERLQRILSSRNDLVLVASDSEGRLVGWIHGFLSQYLESDYRVEIGGLVVDSHTRRKGVGRRLVLAIEAWARESGVCEVSVRCRSDRTESHYFYENMNFRCIKEQRVFRKRIHLPAQP
jgi:N-acetylglutamate synthase-like GNAT family acetyltransferase